MNIFPDKVLNLPIVAEGARYPLIGAQANKPAIIFGMVYRARVKHQSPNQTGMDIEQLRLRDGLVLFKFRAMFRFGCDITKTGFIAQTLEEICEWLEMSPDDFCVSQIVRDETCDSIANGGRDDDHD